MADRARYHHGDLRRALLDAAEAMVAEHGIAAVTMSAVARRAGVSTGAPYRHFEDRVALLRALAQRGRRAVAQRMEGASQGAPEPLEGFRRAGIEYVRFAVEHPALFRVMNTSTLSPAPSPDDRPDDTAFTEALRALLHAGDPAASLDPAHPVVQQLAARCMMHGLAQMFVDGLHVQLDVGPREAERIADALTRVSGPPSLDPPPDSDREARDVAPPGSKPAPPGNADDPGPV